MESSLWSLYCHDSRGLHEIKEAGFKPSGKLWSDISNLLQVLNAKIHPCFKDQIPTESENFSAMSYRFDNFSFKVLMFVLTTANVKQIRFNNCDLNEDLIAMIIEIISLDHINWLQIDWNPGLQDYKYSELLRGDSKLQVLSLKACNLGDNALSYICEALKENKKLKTLDLYGNRIYSLTPIAEMLEVNRSLMHLNLAKNELTDEQLMPLVGAFGKIPFPSERVEEFRRREKEIIKEKAMKNKGHGEIEPPADELIEEEESGQCFLMKNKVFSRLNLSLNKIESDRQLRLILIQALPHFKILMKNNPIPELVKRPLVIGFSQNLVI
ncbi:unnamed protein product [Blepharisma stoltei]|uniref:Uncharacterized protein n=1 Tax=Blepharisma stoltei TaxID=1481888 RepID=A0AAU9J925_9CILI|nr:unnamed protein product [Blepharisma stoltei]